MALHHGVRALFFFFCDCIWRPETLPIPETAPRKPATSPYGNTKQIGEDILRDTTVMANGLLRSWLLSATSTRSARILPDSSENCLSGPRTISFLSHANRRRSQSSSHRLRGMIHRPDGTGIRDFIHVVDLAQAHIATLESLFAEQKSTETFTVYNIGTGKGTSVKDLSRLSNASPESRSCIPSVRAGQGDIASCYADPQKIKKELGWKLNSPSPRLSRMPGAGKRTPETIKIPKHLLLTYALPLLKEYLDSYSLPITKARS